MTRWDVLGVGCSAIDEVLYVKSFSRPNEKIRVLRSERQVGGLTAIALVAAARLGATCAFAGVLGYDPLSNEVASFLASEGVDMSVTPRQADAHPIRATVVVDLDSAARTIFFNLDAVVGATGTQPVAEVVRSAKVLFIDGSAVPGAVRVAEIARAAGIAVVADFEADDDPQFPELLGLVDHLIVPRALACRMTGESSPEAAVRRLRSSDRSVVVTCGEDGAWYAEGGDPAVAHEPALAVAAVDTTGCGDVFHGAYAVALARGDAMVERVRFANVAAGIKASRPGWAGIATREEVVARMKAARSHEHA